jgi:sugar lactone lactonase YvrE
MAIPRKPWNSICARAAAVLLCAIAALAQRPSNPALLVPENAPDLNFSVTLNPLPIPEGMTMGAPAATAFDSKGHLFVLYRGPKALAEFDNDGKFVRAFAEGMFTRTHGLRIDRDDNIWITDVGSHIVVKMNPKGEVLMTLGTKGQAGVWDETAGTRLFNEPNDVVIAPDGDFFVTQGHLPGPGRGNPRVLKFDKTGKFLKTWGGKGTGPGEFDVAHGLQIDSKGLLWVTDRENQRIQIFDQDGKYLREVKFAGLPCGLDFSGGYIYMVNGFAGQLLKLDLNGKVLAAMGKPGKGAGEFGEAHAVTVGPKGEVFIADTVNSTLQVFKAK